MRLAKLFWQHTGMGISSRLAEHCLSMLPEESSIRPGPPSPPIGRSTQGRNKHYSARGSISSPKCTGRNVFATQQASLPEDLSRDQSVYLEERYGRNLPVGSAAAAKHALRRRIAGVLVRDSPEDCSGKPYAGGEDAEIGPSSRGVTNVTENDVYLFATGMTAIWHAHHVALVTRPEAKSICFGYVIHFSVLVADLASYELFPRFPYTDTLKILQKWGPGCHFLGYGLDTDIDELERILERDHSSSPSHPPALALFTEFPSNPLLRSADLPRLRALANKYDFLIVIDETVGNFVNVEVLPYADIVVSSLSKIFSGDANVMGGRFVFFLLSSY
jgi:cystathionine gamma-synthase